MQHKDRLPDAERIARRQYREAHADQARARAEAWRKANPDKTAAQSRAWAKANPEARRLMQHKRRVSKKGGEVSPDIYQRLRVLQKGACAVCRAKLAVTSEHLDHIMPLALGGLHADNNLQLLCPPCNLSKNAKHPVEFMQQRGFLL